MRTKRVQQSILILAFWLLMALLLTFLTMSVAFAAAGTVEFHPVKSHFLAAAGLPTDMELTVYLPPEYATSELAYPVVYLFHGSPGDNRRYFGGPLPLPQMREIHLNQIADSLIELRKISPMIIVAPNTPGWIDAAAGKPWADYILQEILPFVEQKYRVVHRREHRGLYGVSKGGSDVIQLVFMRPDLFSAMAGYAAAHRLTMEQLEALAKNYDAAKFPIRFWMWHGRQDANVQFADSERFIEFLKRNGWEYTFQAVDSDHFASILEALEDGLQWFSTWLGEPQVAVQPRGKLATTWGEMKRGR